MSYAAIGVSRLPTVKNPYYPVPTKTKTARDIADAAAYVMAQLASLQVPPCSRAHTDCGKEFEAALFAEFQQRHGMFHTQSVLYNRNQTGGLSGEVRALKQATIRELLHSGLSPAFWSFDCPMPFRA